MRVDLRQREVAKGETDAARQLTLDPFDRPEGLPRIRALVVSVLEDHRGVRSAPHVIDVLGERFDHRLIVPTGLVS